MVAIKMLFGTDIGLLSVFTIAFVIFFAAYLYSYAKRKMAEDARNAK
jgi:hypothetical protein